MRIVAISKAANAVAHVTNSAPLLFVAAQAKAAADDDGDEDYESKPEKWSKEMLPFKSSRPAFVALLLESIQVATRLSTLTPPRLALVTSRAAALAPRTDVRTDTASQSARHLSHTHTACVRHRRTSCTASSAGGNTATASCRTSSSSASPAHQRCANCSTFARISPLASRTSSRTPPPDRSPTWARSASRSCSTRQRRGR